MGLDVATKNEQLCSSRCDVPYGVVTKALNENSIWVQPTPIGNSVDWLCNVHLFYTIQRRSGLPRHRSSV